MKYQMFRSPKEGLVLTVGAVSFEECRREAEIWAKDIYGIDDLEFVFPTSQGDVPRSILWETWDESAKPVGPSRPKRVSVIPMVF